MKIKKLVSYLSVIGLAMAIAGFSSPGKARAAEITLNLGHPFPEKLVTLTSWEQWFRKRSINGPTVRSK